MPAKVEKHDSLKMQAFADTIRALSIATPNSIVRESIMMLSGAIRGRYKLETPTKINRDTDIVDAVMADARTFIKKIGLADVLGLERSHPCFDFFERCVAKSILSLFKEGEPMRYQVGKVLGRTWADQSMIDAAFARLRQQNEDFVESKCDNIRGKQADDIQLLVQDLFSFLARRCCNEDGTFLVTKEEIDEWISGWSRLGLPVTPSQLRHRRGVLFDKLHPRSRDKR